MPTHTRKDSKGCYAQWGSKTKYYYTCGNATARKRAIGKANKQGRAAHAAGYTGNTMPEFQYVTTNLKPIIRQDTMEGKNWIVAPTQMITEGVHNGSDGPILYTADELAKITDVWNNKPVVVYHPEVNGMQVSACSPDQMTARKVGVLLNTKWDGVTKKLGTETWLEPSRIQAVDSRVAEAIENSEMMEVSTGLYMDLERTEGEWDGIEYIGVARNMQPDHLALLPDQKGACSIEDGAGFLRLNQAGEAIDVQLVKPNTDMCWISKTKGIRTFTTTNTDLTYTIHSYLFDEDKWDKKKATEWVKKNKGVTNINTLVMNELSHDDIRSLIYSALRAGDKDDAWIEVVYDDDFIYEEDGKMYMQNYTVNDNQINFEGLPKLVEKIVTYKEVVVLSANNKSNSNTKGKIMDKKKVVDALIANDKTSWTEEQRETLMALEDDVLTNMLAPIVKLTAELSEAVTANENKDDKDDKDKKTDTTANTQVSKLKTMDEYIAEAPPEIRESLTMSVNTMNAEKRRLIKIITANEQNSFTEEFLKTKLVSELAGIAVLAAPKRDEDSPSVAMFLGQGEVVNEGDAPEPLPLPTMNFEKKAG